MSRAWLVLLLLTLPAQAAVIPDGSTLPREAGAPPIPKDASFHPKHAGFPLIDVTPGTVTQHGGPAPSATPAAAGGGKVSPAGARPRPPVTGAPSAVGAPVRALQPTPRDKTPRSLWILAAIIAISVLVTGRQLRNSRDSAMDEL